MWHFPTTYFRTRPGYIVSQGSWLALQLINGGLAKALSLRWHVDHDRARSAGHCLRC